MPKLDPFCAPILGFLALGSFIVFFVFGEALTFTITYGLHMKDYNSYDNGYCITTSTQILNGTCKEECSRRQCDNSKYYICYTGIWKLNITDKSKQFLTIGQIQTSKANLKIVINNELNKYPIGTTNQ